MTKPDKNGDLAVAICPDCNCHSVCDPVWMGVVDELLWLVCDNCMDEKSKPHAIVAFSPAGGWEPIETAPKDRVILVNDTTGASEWAAAMWCSVESYSAHAETWEGWVYDDEALADNSPDGPEPTHWFDVPPTP